MYLYNRMIFSRLTWIITFTFFIAGCGSVALLPPDKTAVPGSEEEKRLLAQGEKYFDQGEYELALQEVQAVIEINPDNVEGLYALASSYMALDDYDKSLQSCKRAARYPSKYLPEIYLLTGRAYRRLDDPWNALRTYRYAAGVYPENSTIHFRLGETYVYLDKLELAADSFKAAIRTNPKNAAAHFELGVLYHKNDYITPALLSFSTVLLLEPGKAEAPLIPGAIENLLLREQVNSTNTDEGDFRSVQAALVRNTEVSRKTVDTVFAGKQEVSKQAAFEIQKEQYHVLLKELNAAKIKSQDKSFVVNTYVPLYNDIYEQGLTDIFVYYIFQGGKDGAARSWLNNHSDEVKKLEQLVEHHLRKKG